MATIDYRIGQIIDRTAGYKPMYYCVHSKSRKYLQACKAAHEAIMAVLIPEARESITSKHIKASVLLYVQLNNAEKKELLKNIALSGYGNLSKAKVPLEQLVEAWLQERMAEGVTDNLRETLMWQKSLIMDFFSSQGFATTADLKSDTAHKFLAWRSGMNYTSRSSQISARTQKADLQALRQLAKVAARNGWISSADIWDHAKVKSIAGVNTKIVEPLTAVSQKEILAELWELNQKHHDIALLLLVTGMRIGEIETLTQRSIINNAINLQGTKTASAKRVLPLCPTLIKIFERGHIFGATANSFKNMLKRHTFAKKNPGIHAHRLRHTFAVNKLLSQTATLQMVSYQLGHSEIGITADLYGKFVPEHFKVGFEEAIKERKELVEWLEGGYFA
ncbi:MAG: hypothetical protein LBU89_03795 [Fibromonadaceae bacterium]|jgi:integrase|nr:hypothetical protein [Fibromonadaceae bacterium]